MTSLSLSISKGSDKAKRILSAVKARHSLACKEMATQYDKWRKDEDRYLAYIPEKDVDAVRRVNRDNYGKPEYTTISLPYSYAMLMTAHTYSTSVFLGRSPAYQFMGRHGEAQNAEMAMESLVDYQLGVGGGLVPHYIWLLDAPKYGVGVVSPYWIEEKSKVSRIVEKAPMLDLFGFPLGKPKKVRETQTVTGYKGNKLVNIRPYDWFPDPRVSMHQFQEGEFCGAYMERSWAFLKAREADGLYVNIDELRDMGSSGGDETQRNLGTAQTEMPTTDQIHPADMKDTNSYGLYSFVIIINPKEWGVGTDNGMEKWIFTCNKEFSLLIQAAPLGYFHDKFPFAVLNWEPEGYGKLGRNMLDIIDPLQRTMDWLINSHFYNVRKTLNNQFVVDPNLVEMRDVINPHAGKIIRRKPEGRGAPVDDMIKQLPTVDVTKGHINDINMLHEFAQRVLGINDQLMGMLAGGGRKTASEVRSSSTFGVSRQKTTAEFYSAMGVAPLAQMLLQNTQQYYDEEQQYRIVGSAVELMAGKKYVSVDPEMIQGFFDFVPIDGTLPVDRYAQANLWREILAQFRNYPELAARYDVGKVFAYVAMLGGVKNVNQFRVDLQQPETLVREAERGNAVPLAQAEKDLGAVPTPSQMPGMGTV